MCAETYNLLSIILYTVLAVAAMWQLSKLTSQVEAAVKSNSISTLNALLGMEKIIADNRQAFAAAGIAVKELERSNDTDKFTSASLRFNEAMQMYLNSLDRFCYCVLKGYFDSEEMRLEHRETINEAMKSCEKDLGAASPHRNIKKIYELWADK